MLDLLAQACFSFLKIGAFSFGGGYSVLTLIESDVIEAHGWLTHSEFVDIVAIAEMTPGPIAVNASTFVGYNLLGVFGGVICSLCTVAVPFILSLIVSASFAKFRDNVYLKKALCGIRPAVIGLIASAFISVSGTSITDAWGALIFVCALLMVWKLKVHPILTLLICGFSGVVLYGFII